ncbi:MAG TPA: hypothetical protein VLM90_06305 [Candidatus Deferrimicrobium sp.]|nr:hypothetical protein [Candidatus Deferrimicrobium sp.]
MPMPRASGGSEIRRLLEKTILSSSEISPLSGFSKPATLRNSVVFPDPLGPSSTKNSPRFTSRSMPCNAATA